MNFVLPPKSQVGILDPEIAGEGQKVILSDGDQVSWSPPPPRPVMPDWSGIKSLSKYFNRTGLQVWPAWLYHPTENARLVKNAEEAGQLGVCYREATIDERGRYGLKHVWDWQDDSKWRPQPHSIPKFDPANPGQGKTYIPSAPNPTIAQNALLEALIPTVTAAVVTALKANGPSAPSSIDPTQWDEFLKFQAWQKTSQAVEVVEKELAKPQEIKPEDDGPALSNALTPEQERTIWAAEYERKFGKAPDGRWNLDRIKTECEKAA